MFLWPWALISNFVMQQWRQLVNVSVSPLLCLSCLGCCTFEVRVWILDRVQTDGFMLTLRSHCRQKWSSLTQTTVVCGPRSDIDSMFCYATSGWTAMFIWLWHHWNAMEISILQWRRRDRQDPSLLSQCAAWRHVFFCPCRSLQGCRRFTLESGFHIQVLTFRVSLD